MRSHSHNTESFIKSSLSNKVGHAEGLRRAVCGIGWGEGAGGRVDLVSTGIPRHLLPRCPAAVATHTPSTSVCVWVCVCCERERCNDQSVVWQRVPQSRVYVVFTGKGVEEGGDGGILGHHRHRIVVYRAR
jgi:hypothetical protein